MLCATIVILPVVLLACSDVFAVRLLRHKTKPTAGSQSSTAIYVDIVRFGNLRTLLVV